MIEAIFPSHGRRSSGGSTHQRKCQIENPRRFFAGDDGVILLATAGRGGERYGELAAIPDAPLPGGGRPASFCWTADA